MHRFRCNIDSGWLYLLAGSILLWAAIVLPAKQELASLQEKLEIIESEDGDIARRIVEYQSFLDALIGGDAQLLQRVIKMQRAGEAKGDFIVFDPNAAKTPLEWLRRRTISDEILIPSPEKASILVRMTGDDRRLWVAGFGGLIIFFGLVQSQQRAI